MKYTWSFNEEHFVGIYDSIEECLEEAKQEREDEEMCYVGEIKEPIVENQYGENLLEMILDDLSDKNPTLFDYYTITTNKVNSMNIYLKEAIDKFLLDYPFNFFTVHNVKEYIL